MSRWTVEKSLSPFPLTEEEDVGGREGEGKGEEEAEDEAKSGEGGEGSRPGNRGMKTSEKPSLCVSISQSSRWD
jgi:hypothetical protein